jgi:hypothetical protein
MLINALRGWVVSLFAVAALVGGCGSSSSMKQTTCPQGSETCACYGNMTCNVGLTCFSNLCVNPATGNGGAPGVGGALGIGGALGFGGFFGTAGSTGAGGSVGTAGNTGAGGAIVPTNFIKNGDFSLGKEYWDLTPNGGEAYSEDYSGGQYCIFNPSTTAYLSFSLGYPPTPSDAFTIATNATYTLTYQASGTYTTTQLPTIVAKIGLVETPYTELYSTTDVVTSNSASSFQTFSHTVSSATGSTTAGLVFNVVLDYYSEICFDNVSLVKN